MMFLFDSCLLDTIQVSKDMTKDSRDHSHSSQQLSQDPTKDLADLTGRRSKRRPEHQLLFLLVYLKIKHVVNNLGTHFRGPNRKIG